MFDDLIGKPFAYGGRGPEAYDCYGLALEVKRRVSSPLESGGDRGGVPDFEHPDTPEDIHRVILAARERFSAIPAPAPFCFVTFTVCYPFTSHVGIVLPDCVHFIHILERTSVCIERLDSIAWKRRITGYYEWQS